MLQETVLDIRLPTSPQKAFELIFRDEEFFKKFATETMKLRGRIGCLFTR